MVVVFVIVDLVLSYVVVRLCTAAERAEACCEVLKTRIEKLEEELRNGR